MIMESKVCFRVWLLGELSIQRKALGSSEATATHRAGRDTFLECHYQAGSQ